MYRKTFKGMNYRRLGNSGLWLSEVGLGLWKWGDPNYDGARVGEHDGFAILDKALELGVTHWDTANSYNNGAGNSERLIGRFFAARGPAVRHQAVLATKIRNSVRDEHQMQRDFGPNESGASRKYILRAVDDCLCRLRTDYIDILYHHMPNLAADGSWETPLDETWSAVDDLMRQGKVLYAAVSNRTKGQLAQENAALMAVAGRSSSRIIGVQNRYNLLDRDKVSGGEGTETEFLNFIREHGIGLIPLVPLAVGMLTGRYRKGQIDASGRLGGPADASWAKDYFTDKNFALIDSLVAMAEEKACTVSQLAIAWLLAHPEIPSVITGITKAGQLEDNVRASALELSAADIARIDSL